MTNNNPKYDVAAEAILELTFTVTEIIVGILTITFVINNAIAPLFGITPEITVWQSALLYVLLGLILPPTPNPTAGIDDGRSKRILSASFSLFRIGQYGVAALITLIASYFIL